jgi:hypothetical protein
LSCESRPIVHFGDNGLWRDDQGNEHGEYHEIEEALGPERASGNSPEVPINKFSKRTTRLPASVKVWQRLFLQERDGYSCRICRLDGKEARLEIDHINGDPRDNSPENLRLLCHKCNVNEYSRRFKSMLANSAGGSKREKTHPPPLESLVGERSGECERKDALPVRDESLELMINREKEPLFRRVVLDMVLSRPRPVSVFDALHEGAERVGISPLTARRYLDKMTSKAGALRVGHGRRGHESLLPRESYYTPQDEREDAI